ncbi:LOW QUALITY PROTEIN: hypothetical protein Cgig2_015778 [Carnegiea gigantea]|uniref:Uncharacterized protein n=1 Tax=Carnegiea gigantea TaxID=171969 RepID=A0A9Q1KGV7_9CARY|nr:LOW QUALITY PROTEIN: hypothetical protein Cgig2_015778 [Carnegiea gigantea]
MKASDRWNELCSRQGCCRKQSEPKERVISKNTLVIVMKLIRMFRMKSYNSLLWQKVNLFLEVFKSALLNEKIKEEVQMIVGGKNYLTSQSEILERPCCDPHEGRGHNPAMYLLTGSDKTKTASLGCYTRPDFIFWLVNYSRHADNSDYFLVLDDKDMCKYFLVLVAAFKIGDIQERAVGTRLLYMLKHCN